MILLALKIGDIGISGAMFYAVCNAPRSVASRAKLAFRGRAPADLGLEGPVGPRQTGKWQGSILCFNTEIGKVLEMSHSDTCEQGQGGFGVPWAALVGKRDVTRVVCGPPTPEIMFIEKILSLEIDSLSRSIWDKCRWMRSALRDNQSFLGYLPF